MLEEKLSITIKYMNSKNTDKMEKYWFKTTGWDNGTCAERCMVKNNGTMIGSVKCRECEFCKGHEEPCEFTGDVRWIKCEKLKEAQG